MHHEPLYHYYSTTPKQLYLTSIIITYSTTSWSHIARPLVAFLCGDGKKDLVT